jgi:DeoR/GlpR family transcriptional regulator of sugar metabolism
MKLRADRLPLILTWLLPGEVLSIQTLAWRLAVSPGTVHRDLKVLRGRGYRIDSNAGCSGSSGQRHDLA